MTEMVRHKPTPECLITQPHPVAYCPFVQARRKLAAAMTETGGKVEPKEDLAPRTR